MQRFKKAAILNLSCCAIKMRQKIPSWPGGVARPVNEVKRSRRGGGIQLQVIIYYEFSNVIKI